MPPPNPPRGPRAIWPALDGPVSPNDGGSGDADDDRGHGEDEIAELSDPFRELRGARTAEPAELDPTNDPVFHPGATIDGRYRVERLIGVGGMAKVYRATHVHLGEPCALKVLSPELAQETDVVARFLREARLMASFKNPHIVRVHDLGEAIPGRPYFAMELLKGRSLDREIQARTAFPVGRAVRLIVEACEALVDVHDAGLVHRDIKPENLFIEERRGRLHVKLLDFGVTKVRAPGAELDVKATQGLVGTPLYMSPEQIQTAPIDPRADVWALGVVLYELVVGETPFEADQLLDILQRVLTAKPIAPSERRPSVPRGLDAVILRCLEKDPTDRFPDVRELQLALKPFVAPTGDRFSVPDTRASIPESRASVLDRLERAARETRPTGEKPPGVRTSPRAETIVGATQTTPSSAFPVDISPRSSAPAAPARSPRAHVPFLVVAGVIAVGAIAAYALLGSPSKSAAPILSERPLPPSASVPMRSAEPSAAPSTKAPPLGAASAAASAAPSAGATRTASGRETASPVQLVAPTLDPSEIQ
ncbi:MAG: protein kinase [Polyangiaceae bacterium]